MKKFLFGLLALGLGLLSPAQQSDAFVTSLPFGAAAAVPPCVCINGITPVSITIPINATSATATVSAVGANSFLVYQGQAETSAATSAPSEVARVTLTNSTTVTATRNTSSATDTVTVNAVIIDPTAAFVDSVQFGTITLTAATSNTATLGSSVDPTRSAVFYLGQSAVSSAVNTSVAGVTLTNGTTVTATAGAASTLTIGYVVVQFNAAVINSIQQYSSTLAAGVSSTVNQALSPSVNSSNSIIAWGGLEGTSTVLSRWRVWAQLATGSQVTYTRASTTSASIAPHLAIIEFKAGVLKTLQRGNVAVASATSGTSTITSVDTTKSFANYTGFSTTATTPDEAYIRITETSSTVITGNKSTAGTSTSTAGWEVPEFN